MQVKYKQYSYEPVGNWDNHEQLYERQYQGIITIVGVDEEDCDNQIQELQENSYYDFEKC